MKLKMTIIIPVYNIKELLEQCIESVIEQTYDNKEVILVDDGSTDGSSEICDSYGERNDFIRVIHQKNKGLSGARNTGIKVATGDYIMFLDSDDYWNDKEALSRVVSVLEQDAYDVLIMGLQSLYFKSGRFVESKRKSTNAQTNEQELINAINNRTFITAAWDKVIKRSCIENGKLLFEEGIISEDFDWCLRILLERPRIKIIDEVFLVHRLGRPGSIQSDEKKEKVIIDSIVGLEKCIELIETIVDKDIYIQACMSYVAHGYLQLLGRTQFVAKNMRIKYQSLLYKYIYLLECKNIKSIRQANIIYKIFGYKILCRVLSCRIRCISLKRKFL